MERTFRVSGVYRGFARAAMVRFLVLCGVAAAASSAGALDGCRTPAVVAVATFLGLAACWNLYLALAWWRERLVIRPGQVIHRGLFARKELDWDHVRDARWLHRGHGALRLSTQYERATIRFAHFEPADRLWLVRLLRRALPQEFQRNWDRFCPRIAMPLRDELAGTAAPGRRLSGDVSSNGRRRKTLLRRGCALALAGTIALICLPRSAAVLSATAGGLIGIAVLAVSAVWHTRRRRQRTSQLRAEALRRWDQAEAKSSHATTCDNAPREADGIAGAAPRVTPRPATAQ